MLETQALAPLHIGGIIFPDVDQLDLTGPFGVLSRIPNAAFHVLAKIVSPVRDTNGLTFVPEMALREAPPLDILVIPGGPGQEGLMEDSEVLECIRNHVAAGKYLLSVCTGALICGAAGVLRGARATTHWGAFPLLKYFGAIPVNQRVVIHDNIITTAGVSAGIDGALRLVSILRGDQVAQTIQLAIQYAPEPPFRSGNPEDASLEVLDTIRESRRALAEARLATARRAAERLGISVSLSSN